jgi:hypothetical protein
VDLAIDQTNNKIWIRVNGGDWNGDVIDNQDPENNVGGYDTSTANNAAVDRVYTLTTHPFTYGEAWINFTLQANGTFANISCPYGAGGYSASSGTLIMPGNLLLSGTSPANDISWDYVCAANDGVITGFTYASGTPPTYGTEDLYAGVSIVPDLTVATPPGQATVMQGPLYSIPNGFSFYGGDTTVSYYRSLHEYDLTLLPTQYVGNTIVDNLQEGELKQGRPWVTFLPSDLFLAGEKGVWYDPNDITTLFQDVAGTIPVTASGQTVALMKDKSGNGIDAIQATAAKRPTFYVYDGEYGSLSFDGVNDFMSTSNINFTGTAKLTASVGLQVDTTNRSAGIRRTTYTGYWANDPAWFNTATSSAINVVTNFTIASEPVNTSEQYYGVFLADYTGDWTFTITSDDESALWIGDTASFSYTIANASTVASYLGSGSTTISMVSGQYYFIRVMYGNGPSAGSLNITYSHTGQSATNDFTGKLFYDPAGVAIQTGSDPSSVNGTFLIGAPSSASDHSFYLRGNGTIIARIQNTTPGTDDVLTGVFDISQATKELELLPRLNNILETHISWVGTNAGTGNFANQPFYIGAGSGGTATFFKGHIYGSVIRGVTSTNTEITNTEAWISSKLY